MLKQKIVFLGAGNMGEALISGLVNSGLAGKGQIIATDIRTERLVYLKKKFGIQVSENNKKAVQQGEIIVLAVKPQQIKGLLGEIGDWVRKEQLVISIAAGIPTKYIEKFFQQRVPLIRVMPNTPALVGEGVTVLTPGKYTNEKHLKIAKKIFSAVGYVSVLPEKLLNAVTALSGSGPAYIFYLAEILDEAAKKMNLPEETACELVTRTILGAGKMLKITGESGRMLRQKVTSPGGTTEAATKYLQAKKFKEIFIQALFKARKRAQELAPK
jgi:pyrroline-5-carboxylate reductase